MKTIRVPALLHDVFGQEQTVTDLLMISLGTVLGGTALLWAAWPDLQDLPWFRLVPAIALILDIMAGSVANFSQGTNAYYAQRPTNRLVFIAIHVHFPLLTFLVGQDVLASLPIWLWTIAGAILVNSRAGTSSQPALGGMVLMVGIAGGVLLNTLSPWLLATGLIFMGKVAYSFAVNHYPQRSEHAQL